MPDSTEAQMLREVIKIKDELIDIKDEFLAALQTGMESVRGSIIALSTEHQNALLKQEQRNATFADRQRVDELSDIITKRGTDIELIHLERRQSDAEIAKLRVSVTKLREYGTGLETRVLNDPEDAQWVTAARARHRQREETVLQVWRFGLAQIVGVLIFIVLAALGLIHFVPQLFG